MPLTPQEEAELAQLEGSAQAPRPAGAASARGGLSPAEEAELAQLDAAAGAPPAPGKPSFGENFVRNLPFSETISEQFQGKEYGTGRDAYGKASRVAGDVATAAGIGAGAIATGGIAPVLRATGAGAAIMAGLEETGIPETLRRKSKEAMDSDRIELPFGLSFKKAGGEELARLPEWARQPAAFAQEIPGAIKSTALDVAPAALATLLGAGAAPAAKAAGLPRVESAINYATGNIPGAAAAAREKAAVRAKSPEALLTEHGGVRTPSMGAGDGMTGTLTRFADRTMEMDPITGSIPAKALARNTEAIENYLNKEVGAGLGGDTPRNWGELTDEMFKGTAVEAKKKFGAIKAEMKELPWGESAKPGDLAGTKIQEFLAGQGLKPGKKGFEFNANATEMPREIFDSFETLRKELKGNPPQSVAELNTRLTQFKNENRNIIGQMVDAGKRGTAEHYFGEGYGVLEDLRKSVIGKAAKAAGKDDFLGRMEDASGEYKDFADGLKESLSKFGNRSFDPEQYVDFVKSKLTGMDSVTRMERVLGPQRWQAFQDINLKALFESSKNYSKGGGMSLDKLRNLWTNPKKFGNIREMFRPDQQAIVDNVIKMAEKSKVNDLFAENASGSGVMAGRFFVPSAIAAGAFGVNKLAPGWGIPAALGLEAAQVARFKAPAIADMLRSAGNRAGLPQKAGYLQSEGFGGRIPVSPVAVGASLQAQQEAQQPRLYDVYRSQP